MIEKYYLVALTLNYCVYSLQILKDLKHSQNVFNRNCREKVKNRKLDGSYVEF